MAAFGGIGNGGAAAEAALEGDPGSRAKRQRGATPCSSPLFSLPHPISSSPTLPFPSLTLDRAVFWPAGLTKDQF